MNPLEGPHKRGLHDILGQREVLGDEDDCPERAHLMHTNQDL